MEQQNIPHLRLNNDLRKSLCRSILQSTLGEREQKVHAMYTDLVEDVYESVMGPYKEIVDRLPRGLINRESRVTATMSGQIVQLVFNGFFPDSYGRPFDRNVVRRLLVVSTVDSWESQAERPWPFDVRPEFEAGSRQANKWDEVHKTIESYLEDRGKLKANIMSALGSVQTLKRLLEEWPDVRPHIPESWWGVSAGEGGPAAGPLMVRAAELNLMLRQASKVEGLG